MDQESFKELFEKSICSFKPGDIINGTVISVGQADVLIDIGYKSESKISISEFDEKPFVNDVISVMVLKAEDSYGNVVLSKKRADIIEGIREIKDKYENNLSINAKVIRKVKGGYIVSIRSVEGFLPQSHVGWVKGFKDSDFINNRFDFKIEQYDSQTNNLVLSRRKYLEEELQKKKSACIANIKNGDIVEVNVFCVLQYKVLVRIDNVLDAFILLKDLLWTRVKDCNSVVKENQVIKAKVLNVDRETYKVQLGIKQLTPDPWQSFIESNKVGDLVDGEVIHVVDFGAFVKFLDGIEGLIHITEMSWTKRINHPKELLKQGDSVTVKILEINKEKRKLFLSLRQIKDNPWDGIEENYPVGKKVQGKIINVEEFGIFVGFNDELVGLLHKTNVDWTNKVSSLKGSDRFKKGNMIDVIILGVDRKNQTMSLGLKQLIDNPYAIFKANNPRNSLVKAKVKKHIQQGILMFVGDIEAFLPISEIPRKVQESNLEGFFEIGKEINVVVKQVDTSKGKIILSLRDYEKQQEKQTIDKYVVDSNDLQDSTMSLGDIISLKNLIKR